MVEEKDFCVCILSKKDIDALEECAASTPAQAHSRSSLLSFKIKGNSK